jgi:hypothetical protein
MSASLAGRLGYHTNVKGLNGFAGLTAGIGVGLGSLIFDYAFEPFGDLDDDTHRVTLRYGF